MSHNVINSIHAALNAKNELNAAETKFRNETSKLVETFLSQEKRNELSKIGHGMFGSDEQCNNGSFTIFAFYNVNVVPVCMFNGGSNNIEARIERQKVVSNGLFGLTPNVVLSYTFNSGNNSQEFHVYFKVEKKWYILSQTSKDTIGEKAVFSVEEYEGRKLPFLNYDVSYLKTEDSLM